VEVRSPLAPSRIRDAVAAPAAEPLPKIASRGKEARGEAGSRAAEPTGTGRLEGARGNRPAGVRPERTVGAPDQCALGRSTPWSSRLGNLNSQP
jgi:hypothetical protein